MQINRPMTFEEKLDASVKAAKCMQAGDREGYSRFTRSIPLPPYLAEVMMKFIGPAFFEGGKWNLWEVEAEFGPDWISGKNS